MTHGDDKGLVLPPLVSQYQVVIVPLYFKDQQNEQVLELCLKIKSVLLGQEVRCHLDNRDNYTPGWKYNYWEMKGVPLRIEIGPKDLQLN